jgi:hypothetical protein
VGKPLKRVEGMLEQRSAEERVGKRKRMTKKCSGFWAFWRLI